MAESLIIDVNLSTDYKSITITDETDWTNTSGTLDSLTSIILYFYTSDTSSADYTYTFTDDNLNEYTANAEITLTFESMFGSTYAVDNWYKVLLDGNDSGYVSNYAGFGSDAYITVKVNENINNLRTPERYRDTIEKVALERLFLDGMKYLDSSTNTDRSIKWSKRYDILNKLNQ